MLDYRRSQMQAVGLLLLGVLAVAGLTWANYSFALQNPGGNDFMVHWVGTRALLMDGASPYSDEVALQIQQMAYGRPAREGEHELRVAYPLYSTTIFLPFSLIDDYNLARAIWMTTLEAALIALAMVSMRLTGWSPGTLTLAVLFLFTVTWYYSVRAVINGNAVVLVALMMAGALAAIRAGRDELAGILLAFATIKPQVTVLFLLFVWIWAFSVKRRLIVLWTVITLVGLSVGAALFVPDWLLQNLREVLRYPGYNPPGTPAAAMQAWWPGEGEKLGWGLSVMVGVLLLVEWVAVRGRDYRSFLWTASLTLVASQWIGIQTDPGNFVVLFIPLILILSVWSERWGRRARPVILGVLLILFFGLWALFLGTLDYGDQPQQDPIMFFPLPLFLFLGLYWIRWWAVSPARPYIDAFRGEERS